MRGFIRNRTYAAARPLGLRTAAEHGDAIDLDNDWTVNYLNDNEVLSCPR